MPQVEYILVTDATSKVIESSNDYYLILKLANKIRKSGGSVTIFKALKS